MYQLDLVPLQLPIAGVGLRGLRIFHYQLEVIRKHQSPKRQSPSPTPDPKPNTQRPKQLKP